MKIILIGYMGSGKSAVGQRLAEDLQLPFYDLDGEIARRADMDIPEIFKRKGEISFRKFEMTVLEELLRQEESCVLSLGGGTPCYGRNLELLKQTPDVHSVYLKASLETLLERLSKEKVSRPLISHLETEELLEDFIRKHLFERQYYYNQSDLRVDVNDRDIAEIVDLIKSRLNQDRTVSHL